MCNHKTDESVNEEMAESAAAEEAAEMAAEDAKAAHRQRLFSRFRIRPVVPHPPAVAVKLLETQAHDFIAEVVEAQRLAFSRDRDARKAKEIADLKLQQATQLFDYLLAVGSINAADLQAKLLTRLEELTRID